MKNPPRVVDLESGTAMVVTDLHGDWDVYRRYRDRFLQLHHQGTADYLILTGDLIHYTGPRERDSSLQIVLDVLALQEALGQRLIYLLGNHEMPHIYSITLQKGDVLFTPRFEEVLAEHRDRVLAFFDGLPFLVRSSAGVLICHAGASAILERRENCDRLRYFSHQRLLEEVRASLSDEAKRLLRQEIGQVYQRSYEQVVRDYLAVNGPDDPRYDEFLVGVATASNHPDFELLWQFLFSRNELQFGPDYPDVVRKQLAALSSDKLPQHVLVSGHMDCQGGYTVVTNQHLRVASGKNAQPLTEGHYLLVDLEKRVGSAPELLHGLGSVFV